MPQQRVCAHLVPSEGNNENVLSSCPRRARIKLSWIDLRATKRHGRPNPGIMLTIFAAGLGDSVAQNLSASEKTNPFPFVERS
jgi:hypothetical protein